MTIPSDAAFGGVKLLVRGNGTHGSAAIVDESSNAFTPTISGNAQVDTTNTKWGTGKGSISFDGSNSHLSFAAGTETRAAAQTAAGGLYTIEFWLRVPVGGNSKEEVIAQRCASGYSAEGTASTVSWRIYKDSSGNIYYQSSTNGQWYNQIGGAGATWGNAAFLGNAPADGTWHHFAIQYYGTWWHAWKDGAVSSGTGGVYFSNTTQAQFDGSFATRLGSDGSGRVLEGQIEDFRYTKQHVRYGATPMQPPDARFPTKDYNEHGGDSLWAEVVACASFWGTKGQTSFNDEKTGNPITFGSTIDIDDGSTYYLYGNSPAGPTFLNGNGSGEYAEYPYDANLALGSSDFTLEFWAYANGNNGSGSHDLIQLLGPSYAFRIWAPSYSIPYTYYVAISSNNTSYDMTTDSSWGNAFTTSLSIRSWNHFAITRSGNTFRAFINGNLGREWTATGSIYTSGSEKWRIAYAWVGGMGLTSGFKLTKGTARYTASFPPPQFFENSTEIFDSTGSPTTRELIIGSAYEPGGSPTLSAMTAFATVIGGEPTLQQLNMFASADGGAPVLEALSTDGTNQGEPGTYGLATLEALTASGTAQGSGVAAGSLEAMTATGEAANGYVSEAAAELSMLTGGGVALSGDASVGTGVLEALTAEGYTNPHVSVSLEPLTAAGVALPGVNATSAASFKALTAEATQVTAGDATGAPRFKALTSNVVVSSVNDATASPSLAAMQITATVVFGGVAVGVATFKALKVNASVAYGGTDSAAAVYLARMAADSEGDAAIGSTLNTYVMNARTNAMTRYPSFPANSFARYNGTYLAAGASGLLNMQGGDSTAVAWELRTGYMDENSPKLKRIPEIILGVKYQDPIRVTVWTNENSSYEYPLPSYRPGELHQTRVKPGKKLRSRYYKVGLVGSDSFELDAFNVPMKQVMRRIG